MNCQEFQERMQQRLDGDEVFDAAELDRHLADCHACRQLQAAARRLEEGLRLLPAPVVPGGFSDRLVPRVLLQRRRQRQWRVAATVTALAAAVLVAVIGLQYWPPAAPTVPAPPVAVKLPDPVPAPSLTDRFAEVGSAVAALARKTTEETVDQTRVLWPDPMSDTQPDPKPELAAQSLWDAGQTVTSGLEPVATSARRAVDLFLRELPPMPSSPPTN